MKTIENLNAMIEAKDYDGYHALCRAYRANVAALETIYGETIEATPADTIKQLVDAIGYDAACATVATLVNCSAWDGRISRWAADWAAGIENSLDENAAVKAHVYSNRIHCTHLDQMAGAMMKFIPETAKGGTLKRYIVTYDHKIGGGVHHHTWSVTEKNAKEARKAFDEWHDHQMARSVIRKPPHAFHIEVKLDKEQ